MGRLDKVSVSDLWKCIKPIHSQSLYIDECDWNPKKDSKRKKRKKKSKISYYELSWK